MGKNRPKSMTIAKASEYFEEHDIFGLDDVKEVTTMNFRFKKKKYVGVDVKLYQKIRAQARKLQITEDSLIQNWLKEKVG